MPEDWDKPPPPPKRDPRDAKTLGEAALNPDGKTYNMFKMMSWLSGAVTGGRFKGLSEDEVKRIYEEVQAKKAKEGKKP